MLVGPSLGVRDYVFGVDFLARIDGWADRIDHTDLYASAASAWLGVMLFDHFADP